jgi:hypothetical protein
MSMSLQVAVATETHVAAGLALKCCLTVNVELSLIIPVCIRVLIELCGRTVNFPTK